LDLHRTILRVVLVMYDPCHGSASAADFTTNACSFQHDPDALRPRQALDALYRLRKLDGGG